MPGPEVLILEPRTDRAELLASACEEAAPDVAAWRRVSLRDAALDVLDRDGAGLVLASSDDSTGFETLLRIVRLFPNLPVIAVNQDSDVVWETRLLHEGADDVLAENEIDGVALARRVRHVLARRRLRDAQKNFPFTDSLTGLITKPAFLFLADRKLAKAQQKVRRAAVAAVEVAGWHDTLMNAGALAADELLMSAVDAMGGAFTRQNLTGRIAPSTFGTLLIDREPNALRAVVAQANQRLRQWRGAGMPPAALRLGIAESHSEEPLTHLLEVAQRATCETMVALAAGT